MIRGISEIGIADSVQMFGGAMVGIQYAQQLASLGSALNGVTNYDTYVAARMNFPSVAEFLERYQKAAEREKVDLLGHFLPPFFYAGGQLIAAAAKAVGAIDEARWRSGCTRTLSTRLSDRSISDPMATGSRAALSRTST